MNLLRFLRPRRKPLLRPLEKKLLEALAEHLSPEARELLCKQIEHINYVRRDSNDKEVNLYHTGRWSPVQAARWWFDFEGAIRRQAEIAKRSFPPSMLFPTTSEELCIASLSFAAPGKPRPIRVQFWVVHGHLFSLQFSQSPRGVPADQIHIRSVKVLADPMAVPEEPRALEPQALMGRLAQWIGGRQVSGLREPLPRARREAMIGELGTALPADYLEIVSQTEGLQVNGWRVHGVSEIRSVVSPEANYYVLAECERGVLVVTEGESGGGIRYFGYEDEEEEMGPSLRDAVDRLLPEQH